jgi:hypothetical protein
MFGEESRDGSKEDFVLPSSNHVDGRDSVELRCCIVDRRRTD